MNSSHTLLYAVPVLLAVTGMGIHGLLSCAGWAPSMFAAGLSAVQFAVCSTNRERVDEEIQYRYTYEPGFRELLESADNPLLHIAVGSSVKCVTSAMTLGVAGVLDASDLVSNALIPDPDAPGVPSTSASAEFTSKHPEGTAADKTFKDMVGPVGTIVADHIGGQTQLPIMEQTTWAEIREMSVQGIGMATLLGQSAAVGLGNEANPVPLIVEHAVNKALHETTAKKAQERRTPVAQEQSIQRRCAVEKIGFLTMPSTNQYYTGVRINNIRDTRNEEPLRHPMLCFRYMSGK